MLKEGKKVPDFVLENQNGDEVKLSHFAKKNVILYFYPKDDTPGCTKEACGFRDSLSSLNTKDAIVLGVSPDGVESHKKFITKYGLPFQLLSDQEKKVAEMYGALKDNGGIKRSTFLIGKGGKLKKAWYGVRVPGHVDEVVETV
jgi:peroxiredoxin Q/BCP